MANDYIEEFLVLVGLDTKATRKQAKEIDKILDGIQKSRNKGNVAQAKSDKKVSAHKKALLEKEAALVARQAKESARMIKQTESLEKISQRNKAKDYKIVEDQLIKGNKAARQREIALEKIGIKRYKINKKISDLQQRQNISAAMGKITDSSGNKINAKTSMFRDSKSAVSSTENVKSKAQIDRQNRRSRHRAKLARDLKTAEDKASREAKRALMQRLAIRKASGVTTDFSRARANKMSRNITESRAFHKTSESGTLPANFKQDLAAATNKGDLAKIRKLKFALQDAAIAGKKLNATQRALSDSAKNMMRTYVSVFALFQGTVAIKRVGQDFQGMEASMLAASGSTAAAAKDMAYLNGVVDEMGLNLKDSSDSFVKLKFALKGKLDQGQIEDLFKNVSMFGTALKIAPEDMKRAQRALIQIDCLAA